MKRNVNLFKNTESLKFYNLAILIDRQILKKSKKNIADAIILKDKINRIYEKCSQEIDQILKQGDKYG